MASSVNIDNLAAEITLAVKQYTEDVSKGIEKETLKTANGLRSDIERDSPKNTGEYAGGWTRKKKRSLGKVEHLIYNKSKPSLAHILENGFVRKNGKRQSGKPHIRNNYDKRVKEMNKNIDRIIKEGG